MRTRCPFESARRLLPGVIPTALVVLAAGCASEDSPAEVFDLDSNVFIGVSMTGDGDGTVNVNSGQLWSCSLAQGQVTASGAGATQTGNQCDWDTYDAGGGGSVTFQAQPAAGSVFGGWSLRCAGSEPDCTAEWLGAPDRVDISVGAEFLSATDSVPPPPAMGVLKGVLYDVDGATPVDSISLVAGPVAGSTGTSVLRTRTGRQDPESGVAILPGGYRLEAEPGRYAVFSVGVVGDRYMSTRGDSANVFSDQTTPLDLFATRADYLDMRGTDLGTIQATADTVVNIVVDYQAWSYWRCPLCGISLGIGVDATALTVYVFDQVAGVHPGRTETQVSIPITVPDHSGTIYATLITTSTSATNIEPGLQQYRDRWAANVQGTTMIPIGTLTVN